MARSKKSVWMCVFPPWKTPHPKKSPPKRKSPPLVGFIRAQVVTFRIDWTASGYSNRTCFPCYQLSTKKLPAAGIISHDHPLIQRHNGDRKLFGVKQQHLPKDLLKFVFHELSFFIKSVLLMMPKHRSMRSMKKTRKQLARLLPR